MKQIPNIITCLNLLAGCMACVMALKIDSYLGAFIFILIAAVFDFLDGFAARLLKAYSKIGAQLDSLADVISFGAAPGFIVFSYLSATATHTMLSNSLPMLAFLIPVFAAVRLAKFNVDTRQTEHFLGLPVPANGIFWGAFVLALYSYSTLSPNTEAIIIIVLVLIFSLLMVSEIPMFSLKFKNMALKGNEWPFTYIILAVITMIIFAGIGLILGGICAVILLYILMSIIKSVLIK